jgi:hypothetical protein
MKVKTEELSGLALDWAAGQAAGLNIKVVFCDITEEHYLLFEAHPDESPGVYSNDDRWCPSKNWAQLGPLMSKNVSLLEVSGQPDSPWFTVNDAVSSPSLMIAICQGIIAKRIGGIIDVPECLL